MLAQTAAADAAMLPSAARTPQIDLQFLRAAVLAQVRLQLAVLSGNRRRALEQLDRLVAIDKLLERLGEGRLEADGRALEADLADQRLAIATEKLALAAEIRLPRLEPAFGAGYGAAIAPEEPVEIVEHETLKSGLLRVALWASGFLVLCAGVAAAAVTQL